MNEITKIHYHCISAQLLESKCSSESHIYVMSIQKVLSPLLIISYVCGSRIIEFPKDVPRHWFGLLYMLLLWSLYNFIFIYVVIPCTIHYTTLSHVSFGISVFIAFLSIIIGIYHNKVRNLT